MIEYRYIKQIDIEQIRQLFESVGWYSARYPEKLHNAFLNSSRVITAWNNGVLVGLIRGLDDGGWQATIDCLLVSPSMQGKGIASELLRRLLREYEDFLYIDAVPEDKRNAPFYEKNGFKVLDDAIPLQIKGKNWK